MSLLELLAIQRPMHMFQSPKKKQNGMALQRCSNNAAERSDKGPRKCSSHRQTKTIHDSLALSSPESRARVRSETLETMLNNRMELSISTESLGTYMNRGSKRQVSTVQGGMGRGCTAVASDLQLRFPKHHIHLIPRLLEFAVLLGTTSA